MEKKLQSKVIKFLKEQGAYVIKTKPGMGTPTGCPDVIALYKGNWAAIEVKSSPSSPYQPGQKATLDHLKSFNQFVYTAYPQNWDEIKIELLFYLF